VSSASGRNGLALEKLENAISRQQGYLPESELS
jgi:hypothetical protein